MRPRIVDALNSRFHTSIFSWLVPDPAIVYAIMLLVGAFVFLHRCKKQKLSDYHALGFAIWGVIGALLSARAFYLLQHIDQVIAQPKLLLEINGATVSFGVYLGGILGCYLYCRRQQLAALPFLDVLASVLGIGPMLGRLACFLNGDDFGKLSSWTVGVRFPHGSYPFLDQVYKGLLDPMADLSLPVYPVQLYGSAKGLLLFILFSYLWKKNLLKPGALFFLFWMVYAVLRFALETFRGDENRGFVGSFSTGQVMCFFLFTASVVALVRMYYRPWSWLRTPGHSAEV